MGAKVRCFTCLKLPQLFPFFTFVFLFTLFVRFYFLNFVAIMILISDLFVIYAHYIPSPLLNTPHT